ncbi:uncharacterized protein LOC126837379 [Adelges cooleyi]|uniref:uncharacterized protein LOC126837379 n=1 Tax=Adelges cooleyi TaxID=133065 RepID=UPI00217FFA3E|nr:uncharacterized protein LOC126837379 [Adelges cooleyi]
MHFKNAVILCMLYFVTVTQSAGLNEQQAADIVDFFNDFETTTNEIPKEDIVSFGIDIGMKDMNDFTYNEALTDAQKAQDLLILLANNDKTSDRWTKKNVSSFEVTIIVTVFRKFDEKVVNDGLIDYNELKNLVDSLSLTQEFKDDLKGAFDTDDTAINAAELVKAYLSVKPRKKIHSYTYMIYILVLRTEV